MTKPKTGLDDYLTTKTSKEFEALPEHELLPGEEVKLTPRKVRKDGTSPPVTAKTKRNDLQSAKVLISKHRIIQTRGEGKMYRYMDDYYHEMSPNDLNTLLYEDFGNLPLTSIAAITKAVNAHTEKPLSAFNRPRYLNLRNGLYDLEEYRLMPHTPDIYNTIRIDIEHNEASGCPMWREAVQEIVGDAENITVLQEFFGLCLTTDTYDKALILTGEGSNGKSTMLNVLAGILGEDNISPVSLSLMDKSYYVAQLHNKLLNIASEIGSKNTVCDETFKAIVSGDRITADHKFGHPFTFKPKCKLVFATNNMPRTDDKSKALYRRLLVIHLTKEFPEETCKHNYAEKLLTEKAGIFNWMVEGLKRLKERGRFAMGKKMVSAIEEYKRENNPILSFLDDKCVVGSKETVRKRELYETYKEYSRASGFREMNIIRFGKELKRCLDSQLFGEKSNDGNSRIWVGLKLLLTWEKPEHERPWED